MVKKGCRVLTESNACLLFINILSSVIRKLVRVIDTSKPTAKAIDHWWVEPVIREIWVITYAFK